MKLHIEQILQDYPKFYRKKNPSNNLNNVNSNNNSLSNNSNDNDEHIRQHDRLAFLRQFKFKKYTSFQNGSLIYVLSISKKNEIFPNIFLSALHLRT